MKQTILVNGLPVEASVCRNCAMKGGGSKLWPLSDMKLVRHGWYCPPCVERRKEGLAKNKAHAKIKAQQLRSS